MATENDYVAPPGASDEQNNDYVTPPGSTGQNHSDYVQPNQYESSDTGYFDTPEGSLIMYLSGYLILMLYGIWNGDYGVFTKILLTAYALISNYTYCWYAEYKRFTGGSFAWFFTPYGSLKAGKGSSEAMDYRKVTVNRGLFGGYTATESKDYGSHFITFLIVTVVLEFLKFMIAMPIAFVTLFTHKSTIAKYKLALANWQKQ